jgi:hypothetical protein
MLSRFIDKVLNLRMDSKWSMTVWNFCDGKKEFHKSFTFAGFRDGFRSAASCYVDK